MNKLNKIAIAAVVSATIFGATQFANAQCSSCCGTQSYGTYCYRQNANCGFFARLFGRSCAPSRYAYAPAYSQYPSQCATCERRETSSDTTASCATGTCPNGKCPLVEGAKQVAERVVENLYLARVNAVRARYGLSRLALDPTLDSQCSAQCRNMAVAGYIFHAPGCGYEIVACNGGTGIDVALTQWQNSSAHAAILLNPSLTRCGVQTYRDAYGRNYCAMRFR